MRRNDGTQLSVNVGGARAIARKLLKDVGIKEIPVSLWKVIEYLKVRHDFEVLRLSLGNVDGILVTIDGQPTIGFNGDVSWVRKRFTIAHEIGHYLLGHTCTDPDIDSDPEREAHQFAAELLMPLVFLKIDYKAKPDLDFLTQKYKASREALTIHLIECRIL